MSSGNQPIPTRGRKYTHTHFVIFLQKRTNPSPLGDENAIVSLNFACFVTRTNPSPSGDENQFNSISNSSSLPNQPIPKRGRKLIIFYPFSHFHREPTHPQAGTKTRFVSIVLMLFGNQPIPTRGRKLGNKLGMFDNGGNQPIPTRGRKFITKLINNKIIFEPTHPQAGTKIFEFYTRHTVIYRTNPSPSGDENPLRQSNRAVFTDEPTHPHSGTKILCS